MILPFAKTAPRLTLSQQGLSVANRSAPGSKVHFNAPPRARSSAKRRLGNGLTTYMVEPTTRGAPSKPSTTRVLNWKSSTSLATLPVLIWFSELKRVPCTVPAGVVHSLPAAACAHAPPPGTSAAQSNRAVDRTQWLFIWFLPQRSQLALQQLGTASAPVNPAEYLIQKVHLLVRYRPSVQSVGCSNRCSNRSKTTFVQISSSD